MIASSKMRLVLDTNILLASVFSASGASNRIVLDGLAQKYHWACSVALMLEYESVLKRPEHLRRSRIDSNGIDAILDAVAAVVEPVRFSFLWRPLLKDPNDEMVVETAVNGRADLVVTMNLRHLEPGLTRFGIPALGPGESLRILRKTRGYIS